MRIFASRECGHCGSGYSPTSSRQKRCGVCAGPVRKRLQREAMAAHRRENPEKVLRAEADNELRASYGITLDQYEAMLAQQGGKCAVCSKPPTHGRGIVRKLYVDHCHASARVRGLLCSKCNSGIGMFGDDAELLFAAIRYLGRHSP